MRVVHVVTAFPRHPEDPITPWLVELVRRQRAAGTDASVLAPAYSGGPEEGDPTGQGIPVERFRYAPARLETFTHDETVPDRLRRAPLQALFLPLYLLGGILAARRLGRRDPPDVVHVHWPVPHALFGAALRRASGGRTALVCSYYSVEINWIRSRLPFLLPLLRWTVRAADDVTAISSSTARAVRGLVERPVALIPYGATLVDDGEAPAREAFAGLAEAPVRILFVGRLVERKGIEVLVRAVARNRFARPVELRIVGTGEWEPKIREAIDGEAGLRPAHGVSGPYENGVEYGPETGMVNAPEVRLLGRVSTAELRREYEAADIFVLPAIRDAKGDTEGLGVVLLEALRFERPVVGSDIGGIPDIVEDGVTGLLVPPGDTEALAAAIERLIADPQAARLLARRGRARAREVFGWDGIVAATRAAYERAIEGRAATD